MPPGPNPGTGEEEAHLRTPRRALEVYAVHGLGDIGAVSHVSSLVESIVRDPLFVWVYSLLGIDTAVPDDTLVCGA
jgi:hypothetical protein